MNSNLPSGSVLIAVEEGCRLLPWQPCSCLCLLAEGFGVHSVPQYINQPVYFFRNVQFPSGATSSRLRSRVQRKELPASLADALSRDCSKTWQSRPASPRATDKLKASGSQAAAFAPNWGGQGPRGGRYTDTCYIEQGQKPEGRCFQRMALRGVPAPYPSIALLLQTKYCWKAEHEVVA